MSRETKTKEIDGFEYTCTQFPPQKALRILTKLTKYLGGPLAELMKSAGSAKGLMDMDTDNLDIGGALMSLGNSMGPDDLYILSKDVCESVIASKSENEPEALSGQLKENVFDQHFVGPKGLKRLFKVLVFALEVNYGDFLEEVVAGASSAKAAT